MSQDILSEILFKLGDIQNQQGRNTASIDSILAQTLKTNGRVTDLEKYKVEITKILAENQKTLSIYSGIMKDNQHNLQRLLDKEIISADREKNELLKYNKDLENTIDKEQIDLKIINTQFKNKVLQWGLVVILAIFIVTFYHIDVIQFIQAIK